MRYKVGDRVRIKNDLYAGYWKTDARKLLGKIVTIDRIDTTSYKTIYFIEESTYEWYDTDFEPVEKTFANLVKGDKLTTDEDKYTYTVLARLEDIIFLSDANNEYSANFNCHYKELQGLGYKIKQEKPETTTVELTLDQVAEKFGVNVKDLKIKK